MVKKKSKKTVKSIKTVKIPQRAVHLFHQLVYNYPFRDMNENASRDKNRDARVFWLNFVNKELKKTGFDYLFEIKPEQEDYFYGSRITNEQMSRDLTNSFFQALKKIETQPVQGIMKKNEHFQFIEIVFKIFCQILKFVETSGGWDKSIISDQAELQAIFGIYMEKTEYIDLDYFCTRVNGILEIYFGNRFLELFPDGTLEYVEYTEEIQQQYAVVKSLVSKNMNNVIMEINKVRENLHKNDFNEAMYWCRTLTETFFKECLIRKGITSSVINKKSKSIKQVNDMTVSDLMNTIKNNIDSIITYPAFVNQSSIKAYMNHYIQSISYFISTMTSEFSHGKSANSPTTYNATKEDIETTFSFILSFINNFLFFLK